MFRLMVNSGFIYDNVMRLTSYNIDKANNLELDPNFFIDLIFSINPEVQCHTQHTQINHLLH